MNQTITSRHNPLIVSAAALSDRKNREAESAFLIEGKKLFEEAAASGVPVTHVFVTEAMLPFVSGKVPENLIFPVTEAVLDKISSEKSPEGVICRSGYLDKLHFFNKIYNVKEEECGRRVFFVSSVRDPGNLGTLIRTAKAFGIDEIVMSADCADLYHTKTVRASMGALFRTRIVRAADFPAAVRAYRAGGYEIWASMLDPSALPLPSVPVKRNTAFIVGNEGHGLDKEVIEAAGRTVYIPMAEGSVESLNVSAAACVLLWKGFCGNES